MDTNIPFPVQIMAKFHTGKINISAVTYTFDVVEDVFRAILQRQLGAELGYPVGV